MMNLFENLQLMKEVEDNYDPNNFIWDGKSKVPKDVINVTIQDGVNEIADRTFYNCNSLRSIEIPNSVTKIGDSTFWDCTSLQSIEIPNSVTKIGSHTFYKCESLQSIKIPNSVTEIGDSAFSHCTSLQSIEIPNSVTEIGDYAFNICKSLQSIKIPNSVTKIGRSAFKDCTSLKSINIPNSLAEISADAFEKCSASLSIKVGDKITKKDYKLSRDKVEFNYFYNKCKDFISDKITNKKIINAQSKITFSIDDSNLILKYDGYSIYLNYDNEYISNEDNDVKGMILDAVYNKYSRKYALPTLLNNVEKLLGPNTLKRFYTLIDINNPYFDVIFKTISIFTRTNREPYGKVIEHDSEIKIDSNPFKIYIGTDGGEIEVGKSENEKEIDDYKNKQAMNDYNKQKSLDKYGYDFSDKTYVTKNGWYINVYDGDFSINKLKNVLNSLN